MNTALSFEIVRCPKCGASGDAVLSNGLCARCLLGAALEPDPSLVDAEKNHRPEFSVSL